MHKFPKAAIGKYHKQGVSKQGKHIISPSWGPDVSTQGVVRAVLPLKPFFVPPASGSPSRSSLQPLPLSSHGSHIHVCIFTVIFLRKHEPFRSREPLHSSMTLVTNYVVKGPISKWGHIPRHWGLGLQDEFLGGYNSTHIPEYDNNPLIYLVLSLGCRSLRKRALLLDFIFPNDVYGVWHIMNKPSIIVCWLTEGRNVFLALLTEFWVHQYCLITLYFRPLLDGIILETSHVSAFELWSSSCPPQTLLPPFHPPNESTTLWPHFAISVKSIVLFLSPLLPSQPRPLVKPFIKMHAVTPNPWPFLFSALLPGPFQAL